MRPCAVGDGVPPHLQASCLVIRHRTRPKTQNIKRAVAVALAGLCSGHGVHCGTESSDHENMACRALDHLEQCHMRRVGLIGAYGYLVSTRSLMTPLTFE